MEKIEKAAEKIFFTSDVHFEHEWLLEFNNRPYSTKEEMNQALIDNWNKTVPQDGLTYVLGDIGYTSNEKIIEFFNQLNGEKILIRGNHDSDFTEETLQTIFKEIHDIHYIQITDPRTSTSHNIVLCHFPMLDWEDSYNGSWQLFGHLHTRNIPAFEIVKTNLSNQQYDVGVDANNFRPISFYEVKAIIENQKNDRSFRDSIYF